MFCYPLLARRVAFLLHRVEYAAEFGKPLDIHQPHLFKMVDEFCYLHVDRLM